jgi:hypothetical protein
VQRADREPFWVADVGGPLACAGVCDEGVRVAAGGAAEQFDTGYGYGPPVRVVRDGDVAQHREWDRDEVTLGL